LGGVVEKCFSRTVDDDDANAAPRMEGCGTNLLSSPGERERSMWEVGVQDMCGVLGDAGRRRR
jgi:hypothetical protein